MLEKKRKQKKKPRHLKVLKKTAFPSVLTRETKNQFGKVAAKIVG